MLDNLVYSENIPISEPGDYEVLIKVEAAGVNDIDIDIRLGQYSESVPTGANSRDSEPNNAGDDGSLWAKGRQFPRIEGTDCCGRIVAVGRKVSEERLAERVLVQKKLRSFHFEKRWKCRDFGTKCDEAFAEYTKAPSRETYKVESSWNSIELASISCACSTAEGMLNSGGVKSGVVAITDASGDVGSAVVQLAKRRGTHVVGISHPIKSKMSLGWMQTKFFTI